MTLVIGTPRRVGTDKLVVGPLLLPVDVLPGAIVLPPEMFTIVALGDRIKVHSAHPYIRGLQITARHRGVLEKGRVRLYQHSGYASVGIILGAKDGDSGWISGDTFISDNFVEEILK